MNNNCLFVYNPISGKGEVEKKRDYIVQNLKKRFSSVDVKRTEYAGELTSLAENACGNYDYFVFAGGDGSFGEVVNGLKEHENKPVLGYIPTGTVNDIARSTGIHRNISGAVQDILEGDKKPFDVMKVNGKYVMYTCCCGGMTGCSYNTKQKDKKAMGKYAYALEVLKNELKFDEFPVRFESENLSFNTDVVLIMLINSRSVSSFWLNPDGVMNDNKIEVVFAKQCRRKGETAGHRHFRYLLHALKVFLFGYRLLKFDRKMILYEGNKMKIKVPDNVTWNFDGDEGVKGEIEVEVIHNNIEMILPKGKNP